MKLIKRILKILFVKPLSLLGLNINRIPSSKAVKINQELIRQEYIKKNLWLINLNIQNVIDIGANTGQFAAKILDILPDIDLYCFEPIVTCFKELQQNLGSNKKIRFFNIALGNENGEMTLHLNDYSPSSSLLVMNNLHKKAFTFTEKSIDEKIYIRKLDDLKAEIVLAKPLLIKIDVQGFEKEVIKGGLETIKQADIIIIETSFEELYKGQPLFDEIYTTLRDLGFVFKGNFEQLTNPMDGKILQADSIFIKE